MPTVPIAAGAVERHMAGLLALSILEGSNWAGRRRALQVGRSCGRCGSVLAGDTAFCGGCAPVGGGSDPPPVGSDPEAQPLVVSLDDVPLPDVPDPAAGPDASERTPTGVKPAGAAAGGAEREGDAKHRGKGKAASAADPRSAGGPVPLAATGDGNGGSPGGPGGPVAAGPVGADGEGSSRRWLWVLATLGALIALVATIATIVIVRTDRSRPLRVALEALDTPAEHPFTDPVTRIDPADARRFADQARKNRTAPPHARNDGRMTLGSLQGDRPGLYGSRTTALCDTEKLVAQLRAQPPRARAWAQLMGIPVSRINSTVERLTPVLLAHDTAVTNSEYRDGRPRRIPAILQAGTAVLVDEHGQPRVKCSCGNPLQPPTTTGTDIEITGRPWTGFHTDRIVAVAPTPKPLTTLSTIDVATGTDTITGTGATITLDGYLVVDHQGVHVISEDAKTRTTVIDHEVAQAFDDGAGGILYNELQPPEGRTSAQAAIWHLPAGATQPVPLVTSDTPTTRWHTIEAVGTLAGHRVLAYTTTQGDQYRDSAGQLLLRDLATGKDRVIADAAFSRHEAPALAEDDVDLLSVTIGGDRFGYALREQQGEYTYSYRWVVRDPKLSEVHTACSGAVTVQAGENRGCTQQGDFVDIPGSEDLLIIGSGSSGNGAMDWDDWFETTNLATGARDRLEGIAGVGYSPRHSSEIDGLRGRGLVSFLIDNSEFDASESIEPRPAMIVDVKTGRATELPFTGIARFLRAPIIRPKASNPSPEELPPLPSSTTTSSTTTPSTTPPTTSPPATPPCPDDALLSRLFREATGGGGLYGTDVYVETGPAYESCADGWIIASMVSPNPGIGALGSTAFRLVNGRWTFFYAAMSYRAFCDTLRAAGYQKLEGCMSG